MLSHLRGKDPAALSIFFDRTNSTDVICAAWKELVFSCANNVVALCYRRPLQKYPMSKSEGNHRICVHDFFSDPLSWFSDSSSYRTVREECCRQDATLHEKPVILIDDLLMLGRSWECIDTKGCWDGLIELLHDMSQSNHVVVFVHPDLVSEANIRTLMYISQFYVTVEAHPDCPGSFRCESVLRKTSGKVIVDKKSLTVDDKGDLIAVNEMNSVGSQDSTKDIDPASNLTFNLRLSETEKVARANTSLPYLLNESKKNAYLEESSVVNHSATGGEVIYMPDEADDFDDEDPDDDLDF